MNKYNKIPSLYKREDSAPHSIMIGTYREPELELLKNIKWIFTEKIDGTNIRIMWDGNKISFGGKTDNAQIPANLVNRLQELFGGEANEQKFEELFGDTPICLYGESFGAKIQSGGKYISDGVDFILFDVKIEKWWMTRESLEEIASNFDIKCVPIVGFGSLQKGVDLVKKGLESRWGKFEAEGIVCKPALELTNRQGERIITKIKSKDFKTKYDNSDTTPKLF